MRDYRYSLGWKRDVPDFRDRRYAVPEPLSLPGALPVRVDLRPRLPPVLDQGKLGSCTANAIANAHAYSQFLQSRRSFPPSRLFIYYNERDMEGTVNEDSGASIRDGFKCIARYGVCGEETWPYVISSFTVRPSDRAFTEALDHQALEYRRVFQTEPHLRGCLAEGYPIVCGISVFESFFSDSVTKTGRVPLPKPEEASRGGHAVLVVGYDDDGKEFIVQNSWGTGWGDKGFFHLPYEYLMNSGLADDFWTLRLVEVV